MCARSDQTELRTAARPGILLRGLIRSIRMELRSHWKCRTGKSDSSCPGNGVLEGDPILIEFAAGEGVGCCGVIQ